MSVRLRFVTFLVAGIAVTLIPMIIFLVTGVLEINAETEFSDLLVGLGTSLVSLGAATIALIVAVKTFGRPVADIIESIEKISEGDLSPELPESAPAEFGVIRESLSTMCGQMRMVLGQLNSLSQHVVESTEGAGDSFSKVQEGAEAQSEAAARTFSELDKVRERLDTSARGIEGLVQRVDTNAVQVAQMDMASVQLAEMAGSLSTGVDQAAETIREGEQNARALARDIGGLTSSATTATDALREMMAGATRARSDAGDAALIIGNLESETERIGAAIEDVIKGSDAAYESNEQILEVTASLQTRVDQVDDVVEVIGSLAERTKLLSINASIIASEAGEHGRAFAVVANEVKDLAQSTAGAISEISRVIVGLKEGFARTVETIQRGQGDVANGITLARDAVSLLGTIPDQVHKAATCNSEIVGRTERQVQTGSQVETTIRRLGETLERVGALLAEQVSRNERALGLFENIGMTTGDMVATTREQSRLSGDMTRGVEMTSKDFRALAEQVRVHVTGLRDVVRLSESLMSITDSSRRKSQEFATLISDLNRYALYLGDDFRKLGGEEDAGALPGPMWSQPPAARR